MSPEHRIFEREFHIGHMTIGWRTITFAFTVVAVIALIFGPIKANHDAIETGCKNLTAAIRESQGIPQKKDKRGRPIPTPSQILIGIIVRDATPREKLALKRAGAAYPPLRKASCDS